MNEVLCDPAMMQEAHLKIPALLELGLAMRDACPQLGKEPLPSTREDLVRQIQQIRFIAVPTGK